MAIQEAVKADESHERLVAGIDRLREEILEAEETIDQMLAPAAPR